MIRDCEMGGVHNGQVNDEYLLEKISKKMGMSVVYISSEVMLKAFRELGIPDEYLCTYCIGGQHPFDKV